MDTNAFVGFLIGMAIGFAIFVVAICVGDLIGGDQVANTIGPIGVLGIVAITIIGTLIGAIKDYYGGN